MKEHLFINTLEQSTDNYKNSIEYLAYLVDKARNNGKDKAIVFLGAGTSVSAGIPLTQVIVKHIKLKFRKNPVIKIVRAMIITT
ncbi:MAG: hypothetical protein ACRCVT_08590 [Leadbetterella sp.]